MESRTYAPSDDLYDIVAACWTGRWDLRGQAPHVTELISDPCVNFVFEQGGEHAGSRIVGVWTRLWRRTLEGRGFVRGVKVRAGAMRAFLSVPAFQLANRIVPLGSVCGSGVSRLERAVLEPEDERAAFGALEDWLRAQRSRSDDRQVGLAVALVDRIAKDHEMTTVEQLAAVSGLGPRSLQRLFRDYVGASPKWVIRRHRLQEVALRIERGAALAELAAELGYTDQAHLARDFKAAVGRTPSDFAASLNR